MSPLIEQFKLKPIMDISKISDHYFGNIFHYTSGDALNSIITSKKIRCSHAKDLNDRDEMFLSYKILIDLLKYYDPNTFYDVDLVKLLSDNLKSRIENKIYPDIYIISFTFGCDSLLMWKSYTPFNNSFMIGFDSSTLPLCDLSTDLLKCIYNTKDQIDLLRNILNAFFENLNDSLSLDDKQKLFFKLIDLFAPIIKSEKFKEEKEIRLIYRAKVEDNKKYSTVIRNNSLNKKIEVPIFCSHNEKEYESSISCLIIGPNSKEKKDIETFKFELESYFKENFYYEFQVIETQFDSLKF